ncbi:MAG: 50S ribosomal protein L29 [Calditrichaeota bacterium]|nr:MAG: 50S ribosomal protein L29 [Calditrichota bacterium]MBL1205016.1 50S ribosomal protein L29 [Calditrichota bacterium]NOG44846.1 50S ribosomal protein L29 [Calditrichota bacterium]
MKSQENYSELSADELNERLGERIEELENLRMQQATHQITNPIRIRYIRRDIARIKTLIHQQKLSNQEN